MQTSYIRHQLHLHWQKALLIFSLVNLLAIGQSEAQRTVNLPDYDNKPLHYGFQIGIYNSVMSIRTDEGLLNTGVFNYQDTLDLVSVRGAWQQGFSVGFIMDFALPDELWSVRILPNVSFYNRRIELFDKDGTEIDPLESESTVIEVPILLKYKAARRRNSRMYMVGGITPGFQVGGKDGESGGIALKKNNLEVSYGMGFDLYWQLFKFAPEIRFSHGLSNILQKNEKTPFLTGASTHKVTLYLNFE